MTRYVELRRHTDNDGDALTEEGVRAALEIGQQLAGGYALDEDSTVWGAALLGLTGSIVEPIPKGAGVLVIADGDQTRVESIG